MKKINLAKQMLLSTLLVFLCASNVQAYDKLTTTGGTYQLITTANVNELEDGDIVIYAAMYRDENNDWYLSVMGEPDADVSMFKYYATTTFLASHESSYDYTKMPDEITLETVNTTGYPYEYIFKKSGETFALLNNYGDDFYVHGLAENGTDNYPLTESKEPCYWSFATIDATTYIRTQMSGFRVLKAQTTFPNATYKYKFDTHTSGYIALCYKKELPTTSSFSLTLNETGYATMYYANNDVELADGMQAFTLSLVEDGGIYKLRFNSIGTTIPHGTAVMIKGTPNTEYHPTLYSVAATTANGLTPLNDNNVLYGTEAEELQSNGDGRYYKLANDPTKGMRFYWGAANGAAFTNSAHKAYLFIPASSPASITSEFLFADDATAIGSISENNNANKAKKIYDITGRAQGNSHSNAINIVNNKKFIK